MKKIVWIVCFIIVFLTGRAIAFTTDQVKVSLTDKEQEYISSHGPIKMVVDPDWYPYEQIDKDGSYNGIAADLIDLIAIRTGLEFQIVNTTDWNQSIEIAKSGEADVVSFLNKTDERSRWLIFTEPYFLDANVLITREEHDYISNLARLSGETVVLPEGTSIEERIRIDYPNLNIITVKSEEDAILYVEEKKADITLRSMTLAAYIIKNDGHFNLKIAGEVPDYANKLRMGITNQDEILRGILNKGIASITEQDVQDAINHHISINITKGYDYKLIMAITVVFSFILLSTLYWLRRIQRLNKNLKERQEELLLISEKLKESEAQYRKVAEEVVLKNELLQETAITDALTGLRNRNFFNLSVSEDFERAKRYGTKLSIMIIDLDHFKRINDTYGHIAGDEVIKDLSIALQKSLRKADHLARWGGEEFVVLLSDTQLYDAVEVAEKLRRAAESLIHFEKEIVTISIGVSTLTEEDTLESWFERTDRALYHAKQQGRNRFCISEGVETLTSEIVIWNSSWESGHHGIDRQHKELVNDCNALFNNNMQSDLRVSILPELETIIHHIQLHFTYEESVLSELNYTEFENHHKLHQELLFIAEQLLKKSADGNLLPSDVVRFIVEDVVTHHLIQEDMKFFSLFSA